MAEIVTVRHLEGDRAVVEGAGFTGGVALSDLPDGCAVGDRLLLRRWEDGSVSFELERAVEHRREMEERARLDETNGDDAA